MSSSLFLASDSSAVTLPDGYPKDYLFLHFTQDVPLDRSREDLEAGPQASLGFDYRHLLGNSWMVGVHYRSRTFQQKRGGSLSVLSLSNQTQRIVRLYHPLYGLFGSEWSYLIPTRSLSLPVNKEPAYQTEIGVGLNASLWWFLSPHLLFELRGARWRGTKTNRLHGWETTFGLGYAL